MEEDIKKAEKLIEKCDNCKLNECINCEISWSELASIRRIIDRNKELEEEIKCRTDYCQKYIEVTNLYLNSIPKSKIREKIEELDKQEKEELKGMKGQDRYFVKQMYQTKRSVLQDLLEKE